MNGQEVRKLREKLGYTQLQLAIALHVSPGTVHRWENDKVKPSPLATDKLRILEEEQKNKIDCRPPS
ncbi:hypothetical protein ES703_18796 [subsurface metagenome]